MKELDRNTPVCLALGYFDSVHLGHRKLIEYANGYSDAHGVKSAVATFSNNAYKVFNKDEKSVYTYSERCEILSELCELVLPMRFDARLKNMEATEFLDALFSHYDIKAAVCGYDYLFGAGAKGDAEFLTNYCAAHGVDCRVFGKFELDGERVSTSRVKELLALGDIERANALLGAPFMMRGKVVKGRGAGRMFDIPTANLKISVDKLLPKAGVYGTTVKIADATYSGATNIGGRPTFGLTKKVVETMIDGFDDNIYDKEITVYFHKYIRPVQKFETPAALSAQVHSDLKWSEK
ncbi:MAG: riboflavin biosynthesis protein RibF [Clostridiales bacterium]|nr:riboflavin biosynthesis protein RibF [Clostridiales bacterium]